MRSLAVAFCAFLLLPASASASEIIDRIGPGVTPDVSITVPGSHDFNANSSADVAYEHQQNALQDSVAGVDKKCHVH